MTGINQIQNRTSLQHTLTVLVTELKWNDKSQALSVSGGGGVSNPTHTLVSLNTSVVCSNSVSGGRVINSFVFIGERISNLCCSVNAQTFPNLRVILYMSIR